MIRMTGYIVAVRYAIALSVILIFLLPILWFAIISFMPVSEIFRTQNSGLLDFTPTLNNYRAVLFGLSPSVEVSPVSGEQQLDIGASFGNIFDARPAIKSSFIIALSSSFMTVVIGTFAAYAVTRFELGYVNRTVGVFVLSRFVPLIAIVIPLVLIYRNLGIWDTHVGIMLAHTTLNLPIAFLLMRSFFDEIPVEIDQAALMDGASRFQAFMLVSLPMARGGIAATLVLCFIFSWTEFLLSLFLSSQIRTVPVQIALYSQQNGWGFIAALGTSSIVPAMIFIFFAQRHLVKGLSMGAIK